MNLKSSIQSYLAAFNEGLPNLTIESVYIKVKGFELVIHPRNNRPAYNVLEHFHDAIKERLDRIEKHLKIDTIK